MAIARWPKGYGQARTYGRSLRSKIL